jgi:DNA-binding beta-propeller fold protein YncE
MSKARDLADFISTGSILSDGTIESTEINGVTADASELNVLDGITVTTEELNNVAGISTSVQTQLDGKQDVVAGVSDTEIGYLDGVTSNLQTQLDNISVTSGSLTKSFTSGETASITLAQAISPAPVVSVTKEVPQVGIVSKGTWDVNASASNYDLHNTAYDTTLTPSTVGYGLSNASDESKTYTYGGTDNYMQKIAFSTDGTKFYLTGNSPRYVYQYNLTTAWDVSTASAGSTFDVGTDLGGDISSIAFKTDGYKMYVSTYINDRFVEYDLSTAWDVSTASSPAFFSDSSNLDTVVGMWFKPDGTRFYVTDFGSLHVKRFDLSTAWDITTSSYNSQYSLGSGAWRQLQFKPDGTAMYLLNDDASEDIREYTLSTAWDITTASLSGVEFEYLSEVGDNVPGFYIRTDNGATLYVMDNSPTPSRLRQYSIGSSALVLGTGSFASTDVGKRIVGNGGDVTLTSTAGAYDTTGGSAFTDSSTIASGSWSMRGLKSAGDADGIGMTGISGDPFIITNATTETKTFLTSGSTRGCFKFSSDGYHFYQGSINRTIKQYDLTKAFDISTASLIGSISIPIPNSSSYPNEVIAFTFNADGTEWYAATVDSHLFITFQLSTAWNVSTFQNVGSQDPGSSFAFNQVLLDPNDYSGSRYLFLYDVNSSRYKQIRLTSPNANAYQGFTGNDRTFQQLGSNLPLSTAYSSTFNNDGTILYIADARDIAEFSMSTPYHVHTATYNNVFQNFSTDGGLIDIASDGANVYRIGRGTSTLRQYTIQELVQPTSQYHIAVTNSGGQINTAFWTDINTMVADQDAGDGTVHYAVSTDDRTTWSVIKEGSGVRPIVRDNSGTWQYNSDNVTSSSFAISGATYSGDAATFATNGQDTQSYTVAVKPDGTKIYVASYNSDAVYQYDLSTAFDLSTASYNNVSFSFSSQMSQPRNIQFKPDGTEMYLLDASSYTIYQYTMSTPWDLSTASYAYSFSTINATNTPRGLAFKSDGTKMYITDGATNNQYVYKYDLSTAWRVDTATYSASDGALNITAQFTNAANSVMFNPTGTKMHVYDYGTRNLYEYDLSTAWDISTGSYNNVSVSLDPQPSSAGYGQPATVYLDYTSGYLYAMRSERLFEWSGFTTNTLPYSTTATWANSTTNDEFYALQQALSLGNNRMDKTQLDAVTDPNHYTLGDTLDLAIALRMDTASASTPTADGVTINYDAASLNQGAVLGTDYDYDFPDSTTVRVTSNAAQNLKIRVV